MKRTTYIFIGMFFAGIVMLMVGIYSIASVVKARIANQPEIVLSGESSEIKLNGIHTIKYSWVEIENAQVFSNGLLLSIKPIQAGGGGRIIFPKSEYITVREENDTLLIQLDFSHLQQEKQSDKFFVRDLFLSMEAGPELTSINGDKHLRIALGNMVLDSLSIDAQRVDLDSCVIRSLNLIGKGLYFDGHRLDIKNVYLDLDNIRQYNFSDCKIDSEYLTGSGKHRGVIVEGVFKVVWLPKTEDAELAVTLKKGADIQMR